MSKIQIFPLQNLLNLTYSFIFQELPDKGLDSKCIFCTGLVTGGQGFDDFHFLFNKVKYAQFSFLPTLSSHHFGLKYKNKYKIVNNLIIFNIIRPLQVEIENYQIRLDHQKTKVKTRSLQPGLQRLQLYSFQKFLELAPKLYAYVYLTVCLTNGFFLEKVDVSFYVELFLLSGSYLQNLYRLYSTIKRDYPGGAGARQQ
ncbi:Hypothetical_protein [Hexamita inflata]|uniref:Hypothetical_protein n=1 Tax=Hexamita inflata TaxID=28002 RepID=A0AA86UIN6_9EUKA|nr:Hypothetical protein HINF_LOCUS29133 [Hexamita inflata]